MDRLNDKVFAGLFGTTENKIREFAGPLIDGMDLNYRVVNGRERDELVLSVLQRINSPELKPAGEHREADWEDGWRENLNEYIQSGYDLEKLTPKYFKQNVPIRLNGDFVVPAEPDFVHKYTEIFRAWMFKEYLADCESVYEFGCGTGHNLIHLAQLYPDKKLFAFDWAKSSLEIVQEIAKRSTMKIQGGFLNLFDPDDALQFDQNSVVFTFGALEQIGSNHASYLSFILKRKPKLCIDIIGIHELYEKSLLLDYIALLYHERRNYLSGYLTRLRQLESLNTVRIIRVHHQRFGNLYDDSYSFVIWRPT